MVIVASFQVWYELEQRLKQQGWRLLTRNISAGPVLMFYPYRHADIADVPS